MKNICIIGSGSWGTALGINLARRGHNIKIWSFAEDERDLINNEKKCKFLPQAEIPEGVYCTTSFEEAIKDTDIILHVTPSKFTRDTVKKYKQYVTNQPIIICSKGFEKETLKTLDDVLKEELPNSKIAVLSGDTSSACDGPESTAIFEFGSCTFRTITCRRSIFKYTNGISCCIKLWWCK